MFTPLIWKKFRNFPHIIFALAVGDSICTFQDSYLEKSGKLYLWNGLFFVFPGYLHDKPFTIVSQTPFTRMYMQSNGKGDVVPPAFPNLLVYICKVFYYDPLELAPPTVFYKTLHK